MKRLQLRSKEVQEQVDRYHLTISKKDNVELLEDEALKLILINKEINYFYHQKENVEILIPSLQLIVKHPEISPLKKITVDMGAIKFVVGGADIMRPGITHIDESIQEHEPVLIIDQTHQKPLAVGIALYDANIMQRLDKGKVIENIHYIGDKIWTFKIVK